jgi:ABC-type antimicrobial peptide transport system permease subunit
MLWGVDRVDPATYVAVASVLLVTAVFASFGAASRILRLNPAEIVRQSST